MRAYVLFGGVEVEEDCAAAAAGQRSLAGAEFVLAITPFLSESVRATASVVLPIGTFAETSGTFVNAEGRWQSFTAAARAVGESRPGWKVLRVLGNLLNVPGFEQVSSEDVLKELLAVLGAVATAPADTAYRGSFASAGAAAGAAPDVPMYRIDALVRRAPALQATSIGRLPMSSY
jgi:NADH-quinone oxidoreductase subunit G